MKERRNNKNKSKLLKAKSEKIRRMSKKIVTLNNIVKELRNKFMIDQNILDLLENSTENAKSLFNRTIN